MCSFSESHPFCGQCPRKERPIGLGCFTNKSRMTITLGILVLLRFSCKTMASTKELFPDLQITFNDTDGLDSPEINDSTWYEGKLEGWTSIKILKVTFVLALAFFGTIGNALIIGAVLAEKRLKHKGNAFIINMAVADLLVTTWMLPEMTANIITEDRVFSENMCVFSSFVDIMSCYVSLSSSGLIAYDRYLAVCHEQYYRKMVTSNTVIIVIALSWLEPFILCVPAWLAGCAQFAYDYRNDLCALDHSGTSGWFNLLYIIIGMLLPMCVCFYSYFRLYLVVRQSRRRVLAHKSQTLYGNSKKRKTDIEMFATLFIAFMVLVVFWSPYSVIVFMEELQHAEVPHELFRGFSYLCQSSCAVNGFLYGFTSRHFRRGYVVLFKAAVRRCRKMFKSLNPNASQMTVTEMPFSESGTKSGTNN